VFLGAHDLTQVDESLIVLRSIVKVIKHPKFGRKSFNNDIALVQLNDTIAFSRAVGPVCLPDSGNFH
jgi:hypothetical protein